MEQYCKLKIVVKCQALALWSAFSQEKDTIATYPKFDESICPTVHCPCFRGWHEELEAQQAFFVNAKGRLGRALQSSKCA